MALDSESQDYLLNEQSVSALLTNKSLRKGDFYVKLLEIFEREISLICSTERTVANHPPSSIAFRFCS